MAIFEMKIRLWGVNKNHAERRLLDLKGKNIAPYLGAGVAGHPIVTVEEIEIVEEAVETG